MRLTARGIRRQTETINPFAQVVSGAGIGARIKGGVVVVECGERRARRLADPCSRSGAGVTELDEPSGDCLGVWRGLDALGDVLEGR